MGQSSNHKPVAILITKSVLFLRLGKASKKTRELKNEPIVDTPEGYLTEEEYSSVFPNGDLEFFYQLKYRTILHIHLSYV